jgi:uncharacterized protein
MARDFLNFKKLKLKDRNIIESFTKNYPPFSDFTFTNLFSWNTDCSTYYSFINGNLAVCQKDYSTDEKVFSFLGSSELDSTVRQLVSYAQSFGVKTLKLIPDCNLLKNNALPADFRIKEDRDNFDYIYRVEDLAEITKPAYRKQRNLVKNFTNNYKTRMVRLSLSSQKTRTAVLDLFYAWIRYKDKHGKSYDNNELLAFENFLSLENYKNHILLGLYNNNNLVAFSFSEDVGNDYYILNFEKANHEFIGAANYIKKETSKYLLERGGKYLNAAQDLGIPGLRKSKMLWRPVKFLKKYKISLRNEG